ncbi:MAG TPA: hypothetical protein VFE53_13445 [Mucilaginibacter sp.]|jgi:hypothetical protein|nr:hypothetical protein [Mucilaginibacter sp.]
MNYLSRKDFIQLTYKVSLATVLLPKQLRHLISDSFVSSDYHPGNVSDLFSSMSNFRIINDYLDDDLLIICYELKISDFDLPTNRNISIYCYNLTIDKDIITHGKSVFIYANKLIISGQRSINITGDDGESQANFKVSQNISCNSSTMTQIKPNAADNMVNDKSLDKLFGSRVKGEGIINGNNGGDFYLNFKDISGNGSLDINSFGGSGSQGQQGQDGIKGCDGNSNQINGWPPQDAGDGALGGFGGDSGFGVIVCPIGVTHKSTGTQKSEKDNQSFPFAHLTIPIANVVIHGYVVAGLQGESGHGGLGGFHGGKPGVTSTSGSGTNIIATGQSAENLISKDGLTPPNDQRRKGKVNGIAFWQGEKEYDKSIPIQYAMLLLLKADSIYINSPDSKGVRELSRLVNYLNSISTTFLRRNAISPNTQPPGLSDFFRICSSKYLDEGENDHDFWLYIKNKTTLYLNQLKFGYDVFGNPASFVTLIDPGYLHKTFALDLIYLKGFEDQVKIENENNNKNIYDSKTLQVSTDQCDLTIKNYTDELIDELKHIKSLQDEVHLRKIETEGITKLLLEKAANFQNAVAELNKKANNCSFENVIKFIASTVTIVGALVTGGISLVASVPALIQSSSELLKDLPEKIREVNPGRLLEGNLGKSSDEDGPILVKQVKGIEEIVDAVNGDVKKIKNAFEDYIARNNDFSNKGVNTVPESIMAIKKEELEKILKDYTSLIEANELRTEFDKYIDYIDLTNKKRIELTVRVINANRINEEIRNLKISKEKLRAIKLNKDFKSLTSSETIALFDLYYRTKFNVIKLIYLQRKGYNFISPSTYKLDNKLDDTSIEKLNADHFNINVEPLFEFLKGQGFQSKQTTVPLSVNFNDYSFSKERFLNNKEAKKVFEFTVTPEKFDVFNQKGSTNIRVTGVLVKLIGLAGSDSLLRYYVVQTGHSNVYDHGESYYFSHPYQQADFVDLTVKQMNELNSKDFFVDKDINNHNKYNLIGNYNNEQEQVLIGVSPFSTWQLIIIKDKGYNENIEIEAISGFEMYFWYSYQPTKPGLRNN